MDDMFGDEMADGLPADYDVEILSETYYTLKKDNIEEKKNEFQQQVTAFLTADDREILDVSYDGCDITYREKYDSYLVSGEALVFYQEADEL